MSIANKLQTVASNLATENEKIAEQARLLAQINEALDGKTGTMGGGDYSDGYAAGEQSVLAIVNYELEPRGLEGAETVDDISTCLDEAFIKVADDGYQFGYEKGYEDGTAQGGGGEDDLPYGYLKADPTWTDFSYFCQGRRYSLGENLKYSDTANGTTFMNMFYGWDSGTHIIPSLDFRKGTNFNAMFCYSSRIVEIGEMDISNAKSVTNMFLSCSSLERISFAPGCIKISLSFAYSNLLDDASIQSIIDGLADLSGATAQTLTLHATVGAKLTDAQKASASAKNWTLAY